MEIKINTQYVSPTPETDGNMKINNESLSTCQRSLCALLGNSTLWEPDGGGSLLGEGQKGGRVLEDDNTQGWEGGAQEGRDGLVQEAQVWLL